MLAGEDLLGWHFDPEKKVTCAKEGGALAAVRILRDRGDVDELRAYR